MKDQDDKPARGEDHPTYEATLARRFAAAEERCRRIHRGWPPLRPEQAEKLALILTGRVE